MNFFKRRIKILIEYILNRKAYSGYVKPDEIIRILKEPTLKRRAEKYIENITSETDYTVVKLKNIERVLYWPNACELEKLYQYISEIFNERDWHYYEPKETIVEKGDVVLDCGASEGLFSLKSYNKVKSLYIVEPLKIFIDALEKTFKEADKAEIINCALSESSSSNTSTIDELFAQKNIEINYIKADVEGGEMKLLKGARETITRYKPKIAITVYHSENDWQEMLNFIRSFSPEYKYRIKGIYHVNKKPVMLHLWT